jgi:alkyldihydroxyacetonephosphate synthase
VARLARRHGGLSTGAENGRRGYELTFAIAYIRDWIMDHWLLGESFETSIAWDSIVPLCERVKQRIELEHAQRRLPGRPFVTSRVTQLYDTGACVYFYLAYYCKGAESPSAVYEEIEHAARDEVLRCGGSISHHHGIGKIRQPFLQRVLTPAALECARSFKTAVDPENVFGAANQLFGAAGSRSD